MTFEICGCCKVHVLMSSDAHCRRMCGHSLLWHCIYHSCYFWVCFFADLTFVHVPVRVGIEFALARGVGSNYGSVDKFLWNVAAFEMQHHLGDRERLVNNYQLSRMLARLSQKRVPLLQPWRSRCVRLHTTGIFDETLARSKENIKTGY